ncbi:MAG: hypothetical protein QF692_05525 [Alphaproteobacteria bacterium]|jgi:hypothetical protein|nr:hypothetical protein [Alphaproteobacteria bacterium]MDP7222706.1 hypothetical protein [Alphaproteobacteria bacterium]
MTSDNSDNKAKLAGNLITLSDLFRRAVQFEKQDAAQSLVQDAQRLAILMTYWDYDGRHKGALEDTVLDVIRDLADTAKDVGLKSVTLPFSLDYDRGDCKWLDALISAENFAVPVRMMAREYNRDNSKYGAIRHDLDVQTMLFSDHHAAPDEMGKVTVGLISATQDIKTKWRSTERLGANFELNLG